MSQSRRNPPTPIFSGLVSAALLASCSTTSGMTEISADAQCQVLANGALDGAPVDGLVLSGTSWVVQGTEVETRIGTIANLPSHCLVEGYFGEHEGLIGGPYRTGFRMRLPENWNGRFFFQGGGGSNGVVGDATGFNGASNSLALSRGYAVIAQDSGHDNDRNNLADHGGQLVFGFDPQARRDYGHSSLKASYDLGQAIVAEFYGQESQTNIFWGCSKGGQEGMAFAQRYPAAFDGIVAMAPGMSLPRAAVAQAWDTQAFARIAESRGDIPSVEGFRSLFSVEQFSLLSGAALAACDGLDGRTDGVIAAVGQCTTAHVEPELRNRQCSDLAAGPCLEAAQVDAIIEVMRGPQNSDGQPLYAPWAWDSGIGTRGWAAWKTGNLQGPPSLNVVLGGGSLAAVFTSPPIAMPTNPDQLLAWQMAYDFDRDGAKIYAVQAPFTTSAWQDIGMRSTDLSSFRAQEGRLIVPHGTSDPVFSVLDTIAWWDAVNDANAGAARDFVRVFPVPGMNHCGGGPATDQFDSLTALEQWVTESSAPSSIPASAGANSPWPGREMPLCPYPEIALHDDVGSYHCGAPGRQ